MQPTSEKTKSKMKKKGTHLQDHYNAVLAVVKEIKTVGLTFKTQYIFEKLLWILIGVFGLGWSTYFILMQVFTWNESPLIIQKNYMKLDQIDYPGITLCSQTSTRYSIAERLGNYIDPKNMPAELVALQERVKMCPLQCTLILEDKCFDDIEKDYFKNAFGYIHFYRVLVFVCCVLHAHCLINFL